MTQVYLRVFGAALLGAIVFNHDINWASFRRLTMGDWITLAIMGVGGYGIMVYAITQGALKTSLLNVSVVFSTVPFFVYFLSAILFKRKIKFTIVGLLAISVWGVGVLASGSVVPSLSKFGVGDLWVLLSTFMEAIWFIGIIKMAGKLNGREIAVIAQVFAGITLLLASIIMHESWPALTSVTNPWVLSGLIGGIAVNIATPIMSVYVFKHLDGVLGTQLFLFENIFSLIIGWAFYHEVRSPIHLLGAAIVIATVYYMNKIQTT